MRIKKLSTTNYRTLEDISINFDSYYTAICGRNDSGKSNILRALKLLTAEKEWPLFSGTRPQISFGNDCTKWHDPQTMQSIQVSLALEIDKNGDTGLFSSVTRQLEIEGELESLELEVVLEYAREDPKKRVSVRYGGHSYDGINAEEVVSKIRNTRCVILHDSSGYSYRDVLQIVVDRTRSIGDLTGDEQAELERIEKTIHKGLTKLAKSHREELEKLLGRLERKYKVGVSVDRISLRGVPYTVTLGDSRVEVRLEDWGSGTRNRTNILHAIFQAKQISEAPPHAEKVTPVLLIEEPESFLHPSAQAQFARVLQDLCLELKVQVIATTHSPHMLSQHSAGSNVLLERQEHKGALRKTRIVDTSGDEWMAPFASALGIDSDVFGPWRSVIFPASDRILLVEGQTDIKYIEHLRKDVHGAKKLRYQGTILPYDGVGQIENLVLVKFLKEKYSRMLILFDLDADEKLRKKFEQIGLEHGRHFLSVGKPQAGMRSIEGLVPQSIRQAVYSENTEIVTALGDQSDSKARKSASNKIKALLLEKFVAEAQPGSEDYYDFYRLVDRIDKALGVKDEGNRDNG